MKLSRYAILFSVIAATAACSGKVDSENYPIDPEDARKMRHGRLTGEDGGLVLFGKKKSGADGEGGVVSSSANQYLWRASLEALSIMPIQSADPIGGVILTDWYSNVATPNERVRVNVMILDRELRADALRISMFKQTKGISADWVNATVDPATIREIEDAILTRARELKIKREQS